MPQSNFVDPVELMSNITDSTSEMTRQLQGLLDMLCDRGAMIALASDGTVATEAWATLISLGESVAAGTARLEIVKELAASIDRLADPLLLGRVE